MNSIYEDLLWPSEFQNPVEPLVSAFFFYFKVMRASVIAGMAIVEHRLMLSCILSLVMKVNHFPFFCHCVPESCHIRKGNFGGWATPADLSLLRE